MANDRHTMFYMGKEYPNFGGGGSSGGSASPREVIHQTSTPISDNLQIVLNLENKYTNPYVYALNVLPLSSWGGLVVVKDTEQIVYDSTNDTLTFQVYTNAGQNYNIDWVVEERDCSASSGGGGGSIDYSTTEQDTGQKWIDGSAIYQCTYDLGSATRITAGNWNTISAIDTSSMSRILYCEGIGEDGTYWQTLSARVASGGGLYNDRSADVYIRYVTLRYTKVSS